MKAAAVEDDFRDFLCRSTFGNKLADLLGRGDIGRRLLGLEIRLGRVDRDKRRARFVIDDLRGDMSSGKVNTEARTLGGAGKFLAQACVAEFSFVGGGHRLLDGFAFFAADLFTDKAHTFAFVRLGRIKRADVSGALTNQVVVDAFDGDFCVLSHGDL